MELDEPFGKHNGSIKGRSYFSCKDKYGVIVRPNELEIGDFPELDPFDEL